MDELILRIDYSQDKESILEDIKELVLQHFHREISHTNFAGRTYKGKSIIDYHDKVLWLGTEALFMIELELRSDAVKVSIYIEYESDYARMPFRLVKIVSRGKGEIGNGK